MGRNVDLIVTNGPGRPVNAPAHRQTPYFPYSWNSSHRTSLHGSRLSSSTSSL